MEREGCLRVGDAMEREWGHEGEEGAVHMHIISPDCHMLPA